MRKIRKDDEVMVLAGRSKGRRGIVLKVLDGGERLIVENVNLIMRHTKPNPAKNQPGGIIEREASIHVSNVALIDPQSDKPSRVGIKRLNDGRRVRYFKSSGEVIDS